MRYLYASIAVRALAKAPGRLVVCALGSALACGLAGIVFTGTGIAMRISPSGPPEAFVGIATILIGAICAAVAALFYNAFSISIDERARQLGLLASVGASGRQIRHILLFEALLCCAPGLPFGIAASTLASAALFRANTQAITRLTTEVAAPSWLDIPSLVGAALIVLFAALLSSWFPARRIARKGATTAVRPLDEQMRTPHHNYTPACVHRLMLRFWRFMGTGAWIAHKNLTRAAARGRATVAALAIAVALIIAGGSISQAVNRSQWSPTYSRINDAAAQTSDVTSAQTIQGYKQYQRLKLSYRALGAFTTAFAVSCGVLAIANAVSTISSSLALRSREFAVLRSLGMSISSFRIMLIYECLSYALRGLACGFVLGTATIWAMSLRTDINSMLPLVHLSWFHVGIAAGLVGVVVISSMAYALRRAHGETLAQELKRMD